MNSKHFRTELQSLVVEYPSLSEHGFFNMGLKYLQQHKTTEFNKLMLSEADKIRGFPKLRELLKIHGLSI